MAKKAFYERIRDIDRRLIFLFIALSVIIPLIFDLYFPEEATPMVQGVFDKIDNLPDGSRILIDCSYDPASMPELQPMATAWVRHAFVKKHKVYTTALWPIGQQMAVNTLNESVDFMKRLEPDRRIVYGEDYVNLGFKSGGPGVIKVILTNIGALYSTDINGTNIADIPMMRGVTNLKSFDLIISISAGFPGSKEWIQFGSDPAGVAICSGSTAVQTPLLYPYFPQQLVGVLGGLKGAAEYESLLFAKLRKRLTTRLPLMPEVLTAEVARLQADRQIDEELREKLIAEKNAQLVALKAVDIEKLNDRELVDLSVGIFGYTQKGIRRMGPQAIAHMVIVLFIVIGNITFFIDRRRSKQ
ncbi:MAG: hypothetical protein P9L99_01105 [Candidatus Lernaella stagnicola]|nr:hypothetical protein [Candidatus Lernaella stagnicola]